MTKAIPITPVIKFEDSKGLALAGGEVMTRIAGTNLPKTTYIDESGQTPHTNPIKLNDKGEATIYFDTHSKVDMDVYNFKGVFIETIYYEDNGESSSSIISGDGVHYQPPDNLQEVQAGNLVSAYIGDEIVVANAITSADAKSTDYTPITNTYHPTIYTPIVTPQGDRIIEFSLNDFQGFRYIMNQAGVRLQVGTDYTYIKDTTKYTITFLNGVADNEKVMVLNTRSFNIDFMGEVQKIKGDYNSFTTPSNFNPNRKGILKIGTSHFDVLSNKFVPSLKTYDLASMLADSNQLPTDTATLPDDFIIEHLDEVYDIEAIKCVGDGITPEIYRAYIWGELKENTKINISYYYNTSPTDVTKADLFNSYAVQPIPQGAYIEFDRTQLKVFDFLDFTKCKLFDKVHNELTIGDYINQPTSVNPDTNMIELWLDSSDSKYKGMAGAKDNQYLGVVLKGASAKGITKQMSQYTFDKLDKLNYKQLEIADSEIGSLPTNFTKLAILDSAGNSSFQDDSYVLVYDYERLLILDGTGLDLKNQDNSFRGLSRTHLDGYITQTYGNSVKKASNQLYRIEFNLSSTINYVKAGSSGFAEKWNNFSKEGIFTMKDKLPLWETIPLVSLGKFGSPLDTGYFRQYIKQTPQGIAPYYATSVRRDTDTLTNIGVPTTFEGDAIFKLEEATECNMILYDLTILKD